MKVLLIDDDTVQRHVRALILERASCEVAEADGSADAVRIIAENPDALVICDHLLKGETGVEVVWALRRIVPDLKIAILSGKVDLEPEYAGLGVEILCKPLAPEKLIAIANGSTYGK